MSHGMPRDIDERQPMNETLSSEARVLRALRDLAKRTRDGSLMFAHAVDVCTSTLAVIGIECNRATFLQHCVAEGLGENLGHKLWWRLAPHS